MATYDKAHELARAIKESSEYIKYRELKEGLKSNPELKEKIEEFEKLRYEVQVLTMKKEEQDPEKVQKLQGLYQILVENADVKNFFDAEVAFNVMLADVNKIIAESVKDVLQ